MALIDKMRAEPQIWDLFTKKEEYNPPFLDQYERFPYYLSKHRDVMEPTISKYLIDNGLDPEYPDGKRFAVCLTHDIDVIKQRYVSCMAESIKSTLKGNYRDSVQYTLCGLNKKKHPFWNFKEIMKVEEKYDAKSSFYFLALKPGEKDYNYDLKEVTREMKEISDSGWEVGLHGGHGSYNNIEQMVQEKKLLEEILEKEVIGYRNHYLRFKIPDTWELLSKAGFKYDTTFGYADCVGFRNGMCHPFKPFNLNTGEQIDILEIPLTIMDCTLLRDYMRLDFEKAWELTKQLIDKVEQYRGVITILWHNSYMSGYYLKFYEKLLKYCSDKNAWITSGAEICNWWDENV
jgi:peptidoglycan/xylan/chitin deacetylase (PgdA/CDA1 family)